MIKWHNKEALQLLENSFRVQNYQVNLRWQHFLNYVQKLEAVVEIARPFAEHGYGSTTSEKHLYEALKALEK